MPPNAIRPGVAALALLLALATGTPAAPAERDKPGRPLQAEDLEIIWKDFTQNDEAGTRKAWQDIAALVHAPQLAVPFLKERLKPVPRPDSKRIAQWLTDLDSKNFKTRDSALKELEGLGELAVPAIEKKLGDDKLSLDARRHLELLLQNPRTVLSGEELRSVRAIEVLEEIGTPEARAVLDNLAGGADGALLTEQARRAVARLGRRSENKN